MEHFEFLYLLHQAHLLRKYAVEAEKEGEEFHVSERFAPLSCGVEAEAQIRKINPSDADPMLILRLRYKPGLANSLENVVKAAHDFFSGNYTAVPLAIEDRGWVEHVFFSHDIPRPVTIKSEDSAPS